ncbi:MAG TPA: alcohol dehydrogenase [Alphaproteobacteria bacterium]|nr:alcohol dehydrogenase [Alphaproteobacteria bacterium]
MQSYQLKAFGTPLEAVASPAPAPKGSEVLLRVTACGVCHSDLHLRDGYFALGGEKKLDLSRGLPLPHVLGHEIAGEVAGLGPEAKGVRLGECYVVYPWIGCGECAVCRRGHEELCARPRQLGINVAGGYADHVLVPHPRYLFDFGAVPDELACTYACSGLTAYGALKKAAPLGEGDPLVIIGAGGVGLAGVRLAKRVTGAAPIVVDIDEAKRAAAFSAGAEATVDPAAPDAARNLIKATGGGAAAAIDFVGAEATTKFGFDVLRKGGVLVVVGLFGGAFAAPIPMFPLRAVAVVGSYVGSFAEMGELMALARAGAIAPIPLSPRPLADAEATLQELKGGRIVGRAILKP